MLQFCDFAGNGACQEATERCGARPQCGDIVRGISESRPWHVQQTLVAHQQPALCRCSFRSVHSRILLCDRVRRRKPTVQHHQNGAVLQK